MNKLKPFLFVIIGFFIVISVISFFMPSVVTTADSVLIQADRNSINTAIGDLNNWEKWHPLFKDDTSVNIISPNEATWKTGNIENKLKVVQKDSAMVQLNISRQNQKDILNFFSVQQIKDQPGFQVEWRVVTPLKWYPWEKFAGMMMGQMSSTAYQQALGQLKSYLEQ